jgi:hypothetical protein
MRNWNRMGKTSILSPSLRKYLSFNGYRFVWEGKQEGGGRSEGNKGGGLLEFFGITIIIMKSILIIREGRILLDEAVEHERKLSLKVCVGTNIHKYDHLTWNELCSRWETTKEIKLAWVSTQPI